MKKYKKIFSLLLIVLLSSSFLLSGCKKTQDQWVIKVGDKSFTMADLAYDIYLVESEGNQKATYYQETMGMDYWTYEKDGISVSDIAKNTILTRFVMYVILSQQSVVEGFSLSEVDRTENQKKAVEFLGTLSSDYVKTYSLDKNVIAETLNRLTLGDNYYLKLAENFIINENTIKSSISTDDYREYKTECLYVPTVKSENKQLILFTEDEIAKSQATITNAIEKVEAGSDLKTLADEDSTLTYYTRNFIVKDSIPEQEYKEAAITLENGEYSEIITTSYGYYIIKMIDNNSDSRYEEAIKTAIESEKNMQFQAVYEILMSQYAIEVNQEIWNNFIIGSSTSK